MPKKLQNSAVSTIIQIIKTETTAILLIKARFNDVQNFRITTTFTAKNKI